MPKILRRPLAETFRRREIRVAPNIYKTPWGWRVYVRSADPKTGRSKLTPVSFKPHVTLEEVEYFRDAHKLETKKLRRERRRQASTAAAELQGTLQVDAATYLALKTVQAMPSYKDRKRDIGLWVAALGHRSRRTLATRDIDEQLQAWRNAGLAASTVNHRRTALMDLFTTLDGRGGANPVRESQVFEEPDLEARGIPIPLVLCILDAIPDARSHSHLRPTKIRALKTKPRIVLEALTGMRPSQIGRLQEGKHFSIEERWYVIPRSLKGRQKKKRARSPRPMTRKHMTDRQAAAFQRFHDLRCYGPYSASSRRRIFNAAVTLAEARIREEQQNPKFAFPSTLVPYDLRHSFGTEMLRQTKNLNTVAELLDQSTTRMTVRYALAAIPEVLRDAAEKFEAAHPAPPASTPPAPRPPKAPRRRRSV